MKMTTRFGLPLIASALFFAGNVSAQTYATSVVSYSQGPRADGVSPIGVTRSNADNALGGLGSPDVNIGEVANNSASVEFVSLGYAGTLVLEFADPICNLEGADLTVYETSYGSPSCAAWPERALVWAAQRLDCGESAWVMISPADGICQNADLDLGILSWAKYIRIMDITNPLLQVFQAPNQDGFDVDAVVGYSSCDGGAIIPGGENSPNQVVDRHQGNRKNGTPVPANRSIEGRMLGMPQMSDASTPAANYPFYALGYSGWVILKFPYTVFNVAGYDLDVYETTFGDNPARTCASYPEKARFEGSVDGSTWFDLEAVPTVDDAGNTLCRDGKLNIPAGEAGLNYIRVTDVTVPFGAGSTDAYDIDGIIAVSQCGNLAGGANGGREAASTEETIGEGEYGIEIYPNPTSGNASVTIDALNNLDNYTITVTDMMGRVVSSDRINNQKGAFIHNLNVNNLPSGIYTVSVESNGTREISKLVKN
ncbi:MAG: T9SS type A sorting domain-containing protein [Bacteroidetes bacterium]|nr:T9SS type A sorting domain-containing protein [Bacteroidota bacterium]